MLPQIILMIMVIFFPESPRWLIKNGREKEAMRVLGALRGQGDPMHPEALREAQEIKETLKMEQELGGEPSFWNMVAEKDDSNIPRRVHLTVWLQIMQQLVGIGVVSDI